MPRLIPLVLLVLCVAAWGAPSRAAGGEPVAWPEFRGAHRGGVAPGPIPIHFGPATNLAWRTAVPGGHSSPVIRDDDLFLTGYESNRLVVLALDRILGRERWRRELEPGPIEPGSRLSHPATATSATDDERLVSYFAPFGLVAHDFKGRELWRHPLPTPVTQHGASSSPVIAGNLVIQLSDQDAGSYLLALDRKTGRTAWRVERPGFRRGFSTPLPWPPEQPEVVVVAGTLRAIAYSIADGTERWSVTGLPNELVASPVGGEGLIFFACWTPGSGVAQMPGWNSFIETADRNGDGALSRDEAPAGPARQHFAYIDANRDGLVSRAEYESIARIFDQSKNVALAVRPGGSGDVTSTHVLWRQTRGLPYVPTPLWHDGRLYLVRNGGLASCLDARTGAFRYQEERLGVLGDYYASPIIAGENVVALSQSGTAVVYRVGDTLEVLARNPLGEEILATPAVGGDTLYLRTRTSVMAFREGGCVCSQ